MPRFLTNIPSILRLSLLFFLPRLTSRAEAAPLVASEAILVPATQGKFDYLKVDEQLHRLLADHTGNGTLDVFDLPDGKLLGTVPIGAVHDVAIDLEHGKYYVTVSDPSSLTIVNRESLKVESSVATIKVPKDPEFLLYDPVSDRVYQNIKSKPVLLVIDPALNSVSETWSTEPGESPHGLAIHPETHRLFSAGGNGKLSELDSASGTVLASADIATRVDQIAFDPGNKRIYCASGRAGLSVVEETTDGLRFVATIPTPSGAHTIAVDPATHAVWIAYAKENESFVCKLSVPQ